MPGFVNATTELSSFVGDVLVRGEIEPSFSATVSGWLAYTHVEFLLAHREQRGVCKSQANLDLAQVSQDRRSVLRIVYV